MRVKVRMLATMAGPTYGVLLSGAEREIDLDMARALVDAGYAEALEPLPKSEPVAEQTVKPPAERATGRRQR